MRDHLVKAYIATGQTRQAEEVLNAALKQDHRDDLARLRRAELYLSTNRFAEAQGDLEQVTGRSAEARWAASVLARMRGSSGEERSELEQALRIEPGFLPARIALAKNLSAFKDSTGALDILDQAPRYQRRHPQILAERIWVLLLSRDLGEAERTIQDAIRVGSNKVETRVQQAVLDLLRNDPQSARKKATELLKRRPDDLRATKILLRTLDSPDQRRAAGQQWAAAASRKYPSAMFQQLAGDVFWETGDTPAARDALTESVKLNPRLWEAELGLAQLSAQDHELSSSREHLKRVLEITGGQATAHLMLGRLDEIEHRFSDAAAEYRKVLQLAPANVRGLNNLAFVLLEYSDDLEEAYRLAIKAHDLAPHNAAVNDTMGWALYKQGYYRDAQEYLSEAEHTDPSALHLYHLALTYEKLGDIARAERLLHSAQKLDPSGTYAAGTTPVEKP